jgi:GAF domain-containing protein
MPDILIRRLKHCDGLQMVLDSTLIRSLEMAGTDLGNIQLINWKTGRLTISAQHGFHTDFLDSFRIVTADDGTSCGRTKRTRRSTVIEDVLADREFAPYRAIAAGAGFRAVQSTPLISSLGGFVGVLSTHFPARHRPSESVMQALQAVGLLAADAIMARRARMGAAGADCSELESRIARTIAAIDRSRELLARTNGRHEHWFQGRGIA